MRMVLNGPIPVEVTDLLARRRALGQDTHDEVWNGEYHMNPAPHFRHAYLVPQLHGLLGPAAKEAGLIALSKFNVGSGNDDYRVPDLGFVRQRVDAVWVDAAEIVVEVLSPNDEAMRKFDHYARHGVTEIFIVDPDDETVQIFVRTDGGPDFAAAASSPLLGIAAADLTSRLDW